MEKVKVRKPPLHDINSVPKEILDFFVKVVIRLCGHALQRLNNGLKSLLSLALFRDRITNCLGVPFNFDVSRRRQVKVLFQPRLSLLQVDTILPGMSNEVS